MELFKLFGISSLKKNTKAPAFSLLDQEGQPRKLSDYKGKWLVLYFYPRDNTFGCTKEACSFRDEFSELKGLNAEVVGISVDDVASHKAFAIEHNLPFTLLSDTQKTVSREYGVLTPLGFANRTTFIIDPEGQIREIIHWANWFTYAQNIKARLQALQS
jgi:peroxiredoxin Q/BCP